MYEGGIGTEPDQKIAERYFKLAAEAGNSNAQYKLAQMYLKKEEPEYTDKARKLLTESAIKGKMQWHSMHLEGSQKIK